LDDGIVVVVLRDAAEPALVVVDEQLERLGAVAHRHKLRVRRYPHHARAREGRKVLVLELLADEPGDEVAVRPPAAAELVEHRLPADLALEAHLEHAERLRQPLALL
jgi:hypothetical protein